MNIFLDTVGCRLNQAEIERMAGEFRAAGHSIVGSAEEADLVIVNTCSVTAAAASDSRQKARQAFRAGAAEVLLTGCLATLEPEQSASLPGVKLVVNNADKSRIPAIVLHHPDELDAVVPRRPLPGLRKRTRAFVKVQDGCDNLCTFCVTRIARGKAISVPIERVMQDVQAAMEGGAQEIVLSGVHLGSWGSDMGKGETITDLISYLLANTAVKRLRLSSIEPWDLDERFFDLWQDPRMCRHLHLPLQSGSASVLKRMLRHTTPDKFRHLVNLAREKIPDVSITTDLIVGFPGETEQEFSESLDFVDNIQFAAGHVFKYSARPETAAAQLPGRIHGSIVQERSRIMRRALEQSAHQYSTCHIGTELTVLWETARKLDTGDWLMQGLTDNYLEIDGLAEVDRCNKIDRVKIRKLNGDILRAEIIL